MENIIHREDTQMQMNASKGTLLVARTKTKKIAAHAALR